MKRRITLTFEYEDHEDLNLFSVPNTMMEAIEKYLPYVKYTGMRNEPIEGSKLVEEVATSALYREARRLTSNKE